jgi:phosphoserine phosphatase
MGRKKPIIAICYDFDGTLSPGNVQEYDFFPELRITPKEFWAQASQHAKDQDADSILSYMCLMLEKCTGTKVQITKTAFNSYGQQVGLFDGVSDWFNRITQYGKAKGAIIEHYIISSGIKEMIEGTPIARKFKKIYASSFMYDQHGVAYWPAHAINYTTKTQFLFRINKGKLDAWDDQGINDYIPKDERPIPFERMIYLGDGSTDIPCMKLVKDQGGYSIGVYKPHSKNKTTTDKLKNDGRVNFVAPANYCEEHPIDIKVKLVIDKMVAEFNVQKDS